MRVWEELASSNVDNTVKNSKVYFTICIQMYCLKCVKIFRSSFNWGLNALAVNPLHAVKTHSSLYSDPLLSCPHKLPRK